ncbi:MAG: type II CAAX endopeptidase family protein [Bacillota bacterium]|nr:type II CAAX endopeptidase family protein [Bacillota bacterium]
MAQYGDSSSGLPPSGVTPPPYGAAPALPPARPRPRFDAGTILIPLLFMLLHIGLQTTAQMVSLALLRPEFDGSSAESIEQSLLQWFNQNSTIWLGAASAAAIALYSLGLYILRRRGQPYVLLERPRVGEALVSVGAMLGCMGFATLYMILVSLLAEHSDFVAGQLERYAELAGSLTNEHLGAQILVFCVLVPAAEELLFRGVLCGELLRVASEPVVIWVSALVFAVFHLNLIQSGYVFAAGLVLGAVYVWTRSLPLTILLHGIYNFIGSSLHQIVGENARAWSIIHALQMVLVPVGLFCLVLLWLRQRDRQADRGGQKWQET